MRAATWKAVIAAAVLVVAAVSALAIAYLMNAAPVVPAVSATEAARSSKPFVVKLHAQWCSVCWQTKDIWKELEKAYVGQVHLVVFDFTNEKTTEASQAEAARLGLTSFFEEHGGWTGAIAVVDPVTKTASATLEGHQSLAEHRAAIEHALAGATSE